jgi:hypothetical protein
MPELKSGQPILTVGLNLKQIDGPVDSVLDLGDLAANSRLSAGR